MERFALGAPVVIRSEFVIESKMLGRRGAKQSFTAFIVPPSGEDQITPPPAAAKAADLGSAGRDLSLSYE
jgi:hypothetical protein